MWRQVLESFTHKENCFVTLTYDDDHLPAGGHLEPRSVQLWLKRARKELYPRRFRYFLVGEYGDVSRRPHYHLSLFGVSSLSRNADTGEYFERSAARTWGKGFVQVAEFNELTAQYVAGYVVKKMTHANDPRLLGLSPEFARMSRRPGLGATAMGTISKALLDAGLSWETGDIPHELRIGGKRIPLGRYLLGKLRKEVGFTDEYTKEVRDRASYERSVDMLGVFASKEGAASFREAYSTEIAQRLLDIEARSLIYSKRSKL